MNLIDWIDTTDLDYPDAYWDDHGEAEPFDFRVYVDPSDMDGVNVRSDDEITVTLGDDDIPYHMVDCYLKGGSMVLEWEASCSREE